MHIGEEQHITEEIDQFQLLEEKIDRLIKVISNLRKEKQNLEGKIKEQETTINELKQQVEKLKIDKDRARERISSVLNKIDQIDTESHGE